MRDTAIARVLGYPAAATPVDGTQLPDGSGTVLQRAKVLEPRHRRCQRYHPVQLHHLRRGAMASESVELRVRLSSACLTLGTARQACTAKQTDPAP